MATMSIFTGHMITSQSFHWFSTVFNGFTPFSTVFNPFNHFQLFFLFFYFHSFSRFTLFYTLSHHFQLFYIVLHSFQGFCTITTVFNQIEGPLPLLTPHHCTDQEGGALDQFKCCPAYPLTQISSITGGQTVWVTTAGPSMEL